ncbi:hypothetical protein GCM10007857_88000 [Bradyrhizobium iriomotense]|uniref:Creatinase N-terminal domain-containing protein n=2 Tax=Bradyrhizobium iriomotense TaxID=441950 RepID=A0ABQ6BE02_9BRAD|nr:hypothetical protein GCM10007857_88000 [Bradyrhizobium iriomotense]
MVLAFPKVEHLERLNGLRRRITKMGLSLLVVIDPAHMNYISGFDSWNYQNTQVLLVPGNDLEPVSIVRGVDAGGARQTTWLSSDNIVAYADFYSDSHTNHAMEAVAEEIQKPGWSRGRIGYEGDTYYFSLKPFSCWKMQFPRPSGWMSAFRSINSRRSRPRVRSSSFAGLEGLSTR